LPVDGIPDSLALYYLALGLLVVTLSSVALLVRSGFGLRLMAVRDDEDAAAELGVNGFTVKLAAFTISAFFTGLAGALVVGVLLVVMVCLAPEGLVGAFNRVWDMRSGVRPASRTDVDESTEFRERSLPI
jgi:ABC-type branched-subunit amino acid transport system permease subunit